MEGSNFLANIAEVRKALCVVRVSLSTIGPPWNWGPKEAQYLLASPWICVVNRREGGERRVSLGGVAAV